MLKAIIRLLIPLLLGTALTACVHKISIQQGNYLEAEQVGKVEVGMSRDQVRFLLGTPIADDPFTNDRWDYVYLYRNGRTGETLRREVVVYFVDDKVSRIDNKQG